MTISYVLLNSPLIVMPHSYSLLSNPTVGSVSF